MQTSSEYLTLALDVRNLTDSLVRLVEEDVTPSDEYATAYSVEVGT